MLNRLKFTNFKAWDVADLRFGKVTGMFGTNSSGKTSLIQFLLMLKHTKDAADRGIVLDFGGPSRLVNLGTYTDVVRNHEEARDISWTLEWSSDAEVRIADPAGKRTDVLVSSDRFSLDATAAYRKGRLAARYLAYKLGDAKFELEPKGDEEAAFQLHASGAGDFRFIRTQGRAWDLPAPIKCYAFPDQARTYFQNSGFLGELEAQYEKQMDQIFYLGPLREYPARDYYWSRSRPADVGWRGERAIEAILSATADREMRNLRYKSPRRPFQEIVAHWLRELHLIDDFRMTEIGVGSNRWKAEVTSAPKAIPVLLTDVGFGVSQILPVITLLYYVSEGSTVILEQPEIHLHPSAQAALADLIINVALRRNIQVFVESHSEYMLQRLQRRIAEEEISADDVRLFFVRNSSGTAELEELEVDLFGNIRNWPENFFGDSFGEIAEAEKARERRRGRTS